MLDSNSSVMRWLERLEEGEDDAVAALWNSYFERLVKLADGRLQAKHRKGVDAEDIALSAFNSFCEGVKKKRFPSLSDRHGLWKLLVSITIHKVCHAIRSQQAIKRGGEFHELIHLDSSTDSIAAVNLLVSREPSPEFAAELVEQFERLMHSLNDQELMQYATWKMEGFSNEEIAIKVNRSTRTVERKLNLIRKIWIRNELMDE
ncbi:MAG: ECF-type sigma factor [Pirellula sp.]|jgi:DNA-directed RNA polymerase specialized sigma24 family protein|nr:ECF-type sigma factor [Pirellula sp.]